MPNLTYSYPDFIPFTKILASEVNAKFNDIKTLLNTTKLDSTNVQLHGLTRDRIGAGTANHVVINDASGYFSSEAQLASTRGGLGFSPSFSGNAGKSVVVNTGETALELGTPDVDRLTEAFNTDVATCTAGEAITANDAVCLSLSNGSGSNEYRVFRCDSDLPNRRNNFAGIAVNSASATPNIKTWTGNADYVTGNVITWSINGRSYTQNFNTDNDTTLSDVATQIAGDPDVATAVVTDAGSSDRVITITSRGALSLNIPTPSVTGGASQPSIAIAQTQAAVGGTVRIRCFGPHSGMSSLTTGAIYYISSTIGNITATPTDTNPVQVGQALSSTVLFVNRNVGQFQFTTPTIFVRSHGGSAGQTTANAQADSEHFNFVSWSTGQTDTGNERLRLHCGESSQGGYLTVVDGFTTGSAVGAMTRRYNKISWSAGAATRVSPKTSCGVAPLGANLNFGKGSTTGADGGKTADNETWNGTTFTVESAFVGFVTSPTSFNQGGLTHFVGGFSGGSGVNNHDTFNGASTGTDTVWPVSDVGAAGSSSRGSKGMSNTYQTTSYEWSGSSWSSSISTGYTLSGDNVINQGPASGYNIGDAQSYMNGGSSAATTSINTSRVFNGTAWGSTTASTNSRAGCQGGML